VSRDVTTVCTACEAEDLLVSADEVLLDFSQERANAHVSERQRECL
jgi:hypothetical protein